MIPIGSGDQILLRSRKTYMVGEDNYVIKGVQ